MAEIILVLGGARSGKSQFAQQLAQRIAGSEVLFVATAEAGDHEMARRIASHRAARPAGWTTLEAPFDLGAALSRTNVRPRAVLVDCLTLLVSNVLFRGGDDSRPDAAERSVAQEINSLLAACESSPGTVIIVSGEVGLGLVPESALGRLYRDLLGWTNQAVAAQAATVYLLVAGLPVDLKKLATSVEQAGHRVN